MALQQNLYFQITEDQPCSSLPRHNSRLYKTLQKHSLWFISYNIAIAFRHFLCQAKVVATVPQALPMKTVGFCTSFVRGERLKRDKRKESLVLGRDVTLSAIFRFCLHSCNHQYQLVLTSMLSIVDCGKQQFAKISLCYSTIIASI